MSKDKPEERLRLMADNPMYSMNRGELLLAAFHLDQLRAENKELRRLLEDVKIHVPDSVELIIDRKLKGSN